MKASKKEWRWLVGGPWDGHKVLIPSDCGTMTFSVGEHRGRYDKHGNWQAVSDDNRPATKAS